LEVAQPTHPAVAELSDVAGGVPWNAFRVSQYWQLRPEGDDLVVMRYSGTDHAALIHRRGRFNTASDPLGDTGSRGQAAGSQQQPAPGSHLILTTPLPALAGPARLWNELFSGSDAWPAFLLLRQMVQSLVNQDRGTHNLLITDLPSIPIGAATQPTAAAHGKGAQQASATGQPDSNAPQGDDRPEPSARPRDVVEAIPVQMFPPSGPAIPLRASGDFVTIGNVDQPGTYWLRGDELRTGFSVNLLPDQTDLTRIDSEQFAQWLGPDSYDLVRDRQEIRQSEGRGEPTRPLYSWLLVIVAAALLLEQILANRFYASSRRRLPNAAAGRGSTSQLGGGFDTRPAALGGSGGQSVPRRSTEPEKAPLV
jgi:hypothetical protein